MPVRFTLFSSLPEALIDHEEGVGGSNSALPVHEAQPVVPQIETLDETSSSACGCIPPSGVFRPFTSMRGGSKVDHSQRNVSDQSAQTGQGSGQADAQIRACFLHDCRDLNDLTDINIAMSSTNPTFDPRPCNTTSDSESEEPRMIGDFDGSASEFWKLFTGEAKSHDDARIGTLKEWMDSALTFVRSYSVCSITDLFMLMRGSTGWFIFCHSHSIRG